MPRAGLVWSAASRVHVKALYGRAFRAPSINEMRVNQAALQGNPNLTPEQVGTLDLGVNTRPIARWQPSTILIRGSRGSSVRTRARFR